MKMNALSHAFINQLSIIDLRIEKSIVPKNHKYIMNPAPIERFVYITKGRVQFFVGENQFYAQTHDMIFLPINTAYHSKWFEESEFMVIDLLLHNSENQPIHFDEKANVLFCDTHGTYRGLLDDLALKIDANGPFDWLERLSLSFRLLCEIARDTNRTELDEKNRKIKAGITYLQNNFTLDFPVETLAEMCCLSVGRFRKIFSECTGMSPIDYRNKLRIEKAVCMLKSGEFTVSETAEAVGIQDVKYFSKLFKRYTGVTPREIKM